MPERNPTRRTVLAAAVASAAGLGLVGTAAARRGPTRAGEGGEVDDGDDCDETTLSDVEIEGLLYMREEEKLARDVYRTLYDEWGLRTFGNVADSEVRHVDAMLDLLDSYGIEDPSPDEPGTFAIEELQALHDDLVARGRRSAVEAMRVGGLIEEVDIRDIAAKIEATDESRIERVYGNLLAGSENHLAAFVSALERRGVDYEAQVLDQETVDEMVDDA
jgi:hypothetical protein